MASNDTSAVCRSGQNLSYIPKDVLLQAYDIRVLDLSANPGIHLNSFLRRFKNVRRLVLQRCAFRGVPDDTFELTQLEELLLSNNPFYEGLNPKIGRLHRLIKLDLVGCRLKNLPESLGDLELLEELYLSRNDFFEGLPLVISRLYGLRDLELEDCRINTVPDGFGALQLLINLNLSSNMLEAYPLCTLKIKKLETLDISRESTSNERVRSGIRELPSKLAETNLKVLKLDGNPITEPPKYIWRQGADAIKSYFRERSYGTNNICPDTINMVGNVAAGKTSIAKYLETGSSHPAKEDDRTHVLQQLKASFGENCKQQVNINDFGGHKIYHSVLPIFLPTDGLVILAYDISREEPDTALVPWLLTVIAKSKQLRLIVVGTHADEVPPERLETAKESATKSVRTVLQDAKMEVEHHIEMLKIQTTNMATKKVEQLRELFLRLEKPDVPILTVSCTKPDPNQGLRSLANLVSSQLNPPQSMPLRWFNVMKDITDASPGRPYIDMEEAQEIYRKHIIDVVGYSDLEVILRYLVSTSQIIWLDRHEKLRKRIFYSPQIIIDECKKVLDHERANPGPDGLANKFSEDMKRYQEGIVLQPFMKTLLQPSDKDAAKIVVKFLKHFNLISEICKSPCKQFVIPSNLLSKEPPQLCTIKQCLKERQKSVVVKLCFIGSLVPLSFFETSISSILTVAYGLPGKQHVQTVQWCNGVIIPYNGVLFASWREDNIVHLAEYSDDPDVRNPLALMELVLKRLYENITHYWHGATPECRVVCPLCRYDDQHKNAPGEFIETLETLAYNLSSSRRQTCRQCMKTISSYSCFPTPKGSLPELEATEETSTRSRLSTMSDIDVLDKFKHKYEDIVERLTREGTQAIAGRLFAADHILASEKEAVESKMNTPTDAARCLVDIVLKKNSIKMTRTFLDILQNKLGQKDLVDFILS